MSPWNIKIMHTIPQIILINAHLGAGQDMQLKRKTALVAGWLVYGAVYAGFATAQTPGAVWVLFGAYGLFYGLTEGSERAMVADLVAPSLRGTAYGWFHFAIGLSTLPASLLMGLLWETFGSSVAFGLGAVLALISALLLWSLLPRGKPG